jgi:hypothetical protein
MILAHLSAIEKILLAQSRIASNAGHPNLRGGPREWFIKEFLVEHLPSIYEIGQGEIINSDSIPNPSPDKYRPQTDIVIYRRDMPKITFSPNNTAFLIEGVVATVESKSTLTKTELKKACEASRTHKSLISEVSLGAGVYIGNGIWTPSHIATYVVAFASNSIPTVANWLS